MNSNATVEVTTFFNAVHRAIACTPNANRAGGADIAQQVGACADTIRALEKDLAGGAISHVQVARTLDVLDQALLHKHVDAEDRRFYADLIETSGADASSLRAGLAVAGVRLAAA